MIKKLALIAVMLAGVVQWQRADVTQQGLINTDIQLDFTVGVATCVAGSQSSNTCPVTINAGGKKNAIAGVAPVFRLDTKSAIAESRTHDLGTITKERKLGIAFPTVENQWKLYSLTDRTGNKLYFVLVKKAKETLLYSASAEQNKWTYQGHFPNVPEGLNFALTPEGDMELLNGQGTALKTADNEPIVFHLKAQEAA